MRYSTLIYYTNEPCTDLEKVTIIVYLVEASLSTICIRVQIRIVLNT